jgi:hypothetical protein
MADREQSQTSKRGMDEKPQHNAAGKGHPTSGSKGEERQHGVRNMGSVGRDERTKAKKETRKSRSKPATRGRARTQSEEITALCAVEPR